MTLTCSHCWTTHKIHIFNNILHIVSTLLLWPNRKSPVILKNEFVLICSLSLCRQHYPCCGNSESPSSNDLGCMAKTYNTQLSKGYQTLHHILDNEWSHLEAAFSKHIINYQLVPPAYHWVNTAEHAIYTCKDHFFAILSTVDLEWDKLLPNVVITLNLLHSSHLHPYLSAHASLFGNYNYNQVPLAHPGTKVDAHTAADKFQSVAPHCRVVWVHWTFSKALLIHYPDTKAECDVLKVEFFQELVPEKFLCPQSWPLTTSNRQRLTC